MVVLGVVLVLLAVAAGVLLFAGTASLDSTIDVDLPGGTLSLPPLTFLITGMVVITVFWFGWVVLRTGMRRSRRRRIEAKEAAREAEAKRVAEEQRLKEEFAARERQLLEERRRHEAETAALKREAGRTTDPAEHGSSAGQPEPSGHGSTDATATDAASTERSSSDATATDAASTERSSSDASTADPSSTDATETDRSGPRG